MMSSKLRLPSSPGFFEVPLVVIQMLQLIGHLVMVVPTGAQA